MTHRACPRFPVRGIYMAGTAQSRAGLTLLCELGSTTPQPAPPSLPLLSVHHPSVCPSLRSSVHESVRPSVHPYPQLLACSCTPRYQLPGSVPRRHTQPSPLHCSRLHSADTCCVTCGLSVLHQVTGDCHPIQAASRGQGVSTVLAQSPVEDMGSSPRLLKSHFPCL